MSADVPRDDARGTTGDGRPRAEVRRFADEGALAAAAAEGFADVVMDAVKSRGRAFVVLSGGSTPRLLYRVLAVPPARDLIPWREIEFFWGDERAVSPDHPDSNYGMAWHELLDRVTIPAQVHRMPAERDDRDRAARDYEAEIRRVMGLEVPRFDLVLLGLGNDGHTASLFPGSPALEERERWVVAAPGPRPDSPRMTMTLPILNRARRILFLVAGSRKRAILREVLHQEGAAYPAQRIAPESGTLTWMIA